MSPSPTTSSTDTRREPMRWQVKVGLSFAIAVGLFALWAWLEHERAKAGLAAYMRQLAAQGEKLDLKDHIRPMPKPEENAAPDLLAAASGVRNVTWEITSGPMRPTSPGRARVAWQQEVLPSGSHADLWPEVLIVVEEHRPALLAVAKALERPRWGVELNLHRLFDAPIPHLSPLMKLAKAHSDAVVAELHLGRPHEAYTNLLAMTRLVQRLDEPLCITHLVRYSLGDITVSATWEALQKSGWTDAQLSELQATWERTDILGDFVKAVELERTVTGAMFDDLRANPAKLHERIQFWSGLTGPTPHLWNDLWDALCNNPPAVPEKAGDIWRLGVWSPWNSYRDERRNQEVMQTWITLDRAAHRAPNGFASHRNIDATAKSLPPPPESYLVSAKMNSEGPENFRRRMANFESLRRLTITAIALERHRLRQGSYPESLSALVPALLPEIPVDFQDAQPLRYRREASGEFLLWSVGDNGVDDGGDGSRAPGKGSDPRPGKFTQNLDAVWPRPASDAEVTMLHSDYAASRAKLGKP